MSLEPLEKLKSLGYTFWREKNKSDIPSSKNEALSFLLISKKIYVCKNPIERDKEEEVFLKQLSMALGGEGIIEEIRINSNKVYKDITLIVFGKSEVLTQDNMEKFKKYYLFSSISEILEVDFGKVRTSREGTETNYASNYAGIKGKNVILIDDVISSGSTMKEAIKFVREQGGTAVLIMVLINKRGEDELDNVPLRALIRARPVKI